MTQVIKVQVIATEQVEHSEFCGALSRYFRIEGTEELVFRDQFDSPTSSLWERHDGCNLRGFEQFSESNTMT